MFWFISLYANIKISINVSFVMTNAVTTHCRNRLVMKNDAKKQRVSYLPVK